MMIRGNVLAQILLVAIGVCLATSVNAQAQPASTPEAASAPVLEPKAIEILKASKKHTSSVPLDLVIGRVVAGKWNL